MFLWKEFFKENKAELSRELRLADVWEQALRTDGRTDGHTLLLSCDGASKKVYAAFNSQAASFARHQWIQLDAIWYHKKINN